MLRNDVYRVNCIYPAFMGEVNKFGIGAPCIFLRLAGCNLKCYSEVLHKLCDTPEALSMSCGHIMSIPQIKTKLRGYASNLVCLTGGEPLMQDVRELLWELSKEGYSVVIETNGSKTIQSYVGIAGVSFVVDVKAPSTGEDAKMLDDNYALMGEDDFVKFVIKDETDYQAMNKWIELFGNDFKGKIAVGMFWGGEYGYENLSREMSERGYYVNLQAHKMVVLYDKMLSQIQGVRIPKDL